MKEQEKKEQQTCSVVTVPGSTSRMNHRITSHRNFLHYFILLYYLTEGYCMYRTIVQGKTG